MRHDVRAIGVILAIAAVLTGCQPAPAPATQPQSAVTENRSRESSPRDSNQAAPAAASNDNAPAAADPSEIAEVRIHHEVLLHAALYRAAWSSSVGGSSFALLQPMQEQDPPDLGIEAEDFRARVLRELQDLGVPVAWALSTWRTQSADYFPGTDKPATRLTIAVLRRDSNQATVTAEVGDRTAGSRSSRQGAIATWDGAAWSIERNGLRVEW